MVRVGDSEASRGVIGLLEHSYKDFENFYVHVVLRYSVHVRPFKIRRVQPGRGLASPHVSPAGSNWQNVFIFFTRLIDDITIRLKANTQFLLLR